MNNTQIAEAEFERYKNEQLPTEVRLRAVFTEEQQRNEGRVGAEGYWIVPGLFLSLAITWGMVKLGRWVLSAILGW